MFSKKLMRLAIVGLVAGMASSASASLLNVNSAILAPAGVGPTGGTVISNTGALAITSPTFSGTVTSQVIKDDPSNPFGSSSGFLTFTYLIQNNAGSLDSMDRFTVASFAGVSTDVSYQAPAGSGILPTSVDRSATGDTIGYSFTLLGSGVISPGSTSALLVVQTNAKSSTATNAYVIDGSTAQVSSYAPAPGAGVPEPATLSIAVLGGAALLFRRRRV